MEHISQYLNKHVLPTLGRRLKKKTRLFIDNEFFAWGYAAKYRKLSLIDVYGVLAKYANYKKQTCFPSYTVIMQESGLKNRNSVSKALKKLEELNIVKIYPPNGYGSNTYFLQDVSVWVKEDGITGDTVRKYQKRHGVDHF